MKLRKEEKYHVVLMISHYKNVILIVNLGWMYKKKIFVSIGILTVILEDQTSFLQQLHKKKP